MKDTDLVCFLAHQRRCVKCRLLDQVRKGKLVPHHQLILLQLHDSNIRLIYGQGAPQGPLEGLPGDLLGE